MRLQKSKLLSTTVIPALVGAGIAAGGAIAFVAPGYASGSSQQTSGALPAAKPNPGIIRLAACNPCATAAACNPCAAKKNPCAAAAACNPCAAGATASKCMIPRLQTAALSACNPCAVKKNPCATAAACNPCAAKKNPCATAAACNPCAAKKKNPCATAAACNPCAAKKNPCATAAACNPCAAKNPCAAAKACNPCNPCAASAGAEITVAEAGAAYDCLIDEMAGGYDRASLKLVANYRSWTNVAAAPYQSATHGSRYVNNYANATGAASYKKFEDVGTMPAGSVLAKDSFVVNANGTTAAGPLFVMEKRNAGFNADSFDWAYTMINPDGTVFGVTKGQGSANVEFCIECHVSMADDQDSLFFLPEESRVN